MMEKEEIRKQAEARLEIVQSEIQELQNEVEARQAEERDLQIFLRVIDQFDATRSSLKAARSRVKPALAPERQGVHTHDILKRDPGSRQTQIATEVVRHFQPGSVITATDVAQVIGSRFQHPYGKIGQVHYISSYLNKEAQCANGILYRVPDAPRGHYRLREDPERYLSGA